MLRCDFLWASAKPQMIRHLKLPDVSPLIATFTFTSFCAFHVSPPKRPATSQPCRWDPPRRRLRHAYPDCKESGRTIIWRDFPPCDHLHHIFQIFSEIDSLETSGVLFWLLRARTARIHRTRTGPHRCAFTGPFRRHPDDRSRLKVRVS